MTYNYVMEKLIFSYPVMFIFYLSVNKSFNFQKNITFKALLNYIIYLQVSFHTFQVLSGYKCTHITNIYCNKLALFFGIIHFITLFSNYLDERNPITIIGLLISIYMILSHVVTIKPYSRTFICQNLELPIFNKSSYILLASHNFHETKLSKEIESLIKTIGNKAIIDAGAYVGDSILYLAKKHPEKIIYAIEPSISNYKFIKKIKTENKLKNVNVLNYLLSDSEEMYNVQNLNLPNASYVKSNNKNIAIKSKTLDELVNTNIIKDKIGLLHFDVEGMELKVLKGSINVIKRDKPIIIVETLGKSEKNSMLNNFILNLRYRIYKTVPESCSFGDISDKRFCRNHIYIPL